MALILPVATSITTQVPCSAWFAWSSLSSAFSAMSWIFTSMVVTMSFPFTGTRSRVSFHGYIGATGDIADEPAPGLAFEQGIVGAFETHVLRIRSCQANGTIGQQAERIQSFIDHLGDKAAFVTALADEGEGHGVWRYFSRETFGWSKIIPVDGNDSPFPIALLIGRGRSVAEQRRQARVTANHMFSVKEGVHSFPAGHQRQNRHRY